jgi:hypothetical protein
VSILEKFGNFPTSVSFVSARTIRHPRTCRTSPTEVNFGGASPWAWRHHHRKLAARRHRSTSPRPEGLCRALIVVGQTHGIRPIVRTDTFPVGWTTRPTVYPHLSRLAMGFAGRLRPRGEWESAMPFDHNADGGGDYAFIWTCVLVRVCDGEFVRM